MNIRRILVAIDFEKKTERVLAYASLFARHLGASLHLVHVIDYLVTPPAYLDQYIEEERRAAEGKLEAMGSELAAGGIGVTTSVVVGRLQASFETTVKRIGADLVVLGFASHALRRSSSEKLIKGIEIPMLVVRGERAEYASGAEPKIKRVVCPVDFSEVSKRALRAARELAHVFTADVDVVHILPETVAKRVRKQRDRTRLMGDVLDQEKKRMADFLASVPFETTGVTKQGEPYKKIVSYAKIKEADLIVIGARGIGLIQGMLIGSVTDAVLKAAPCPVFVIH